MAERPTKTFKTLVVASTLTMTGLGEGMSYSDIQECMEWLCGHPVWTHEMIHGPTQEEMRTEGYDQFPDMPTPAEAKDDYQAAAAKAIANYGETVSVMQGQEKRHEHPRDTLKTVAPNARILEI
jgi:hypothetical protein